MLFIDNNTYGYGVPNFLIYLYNLKNSGLLNGCFANNWIHTWISSKNQIMKKFTFINIAQRSV